MVNPYLREYARLLLSAPFCESLIAATNPCEDPSLRLASSSEDSTSGRAVFGQGLIALLALLALFLCGLPRAAKDTIGAKDYKVLQASSGNKGLRAVRLVKAAI